MNSNSETETPKGVISDKPTPPEPPDPMVIAVVEPQPTKGAHRTNDPRPNLDGLNNQGGSESHSTGTGLSGMDTNNVVSPKTRHTQCHEHTRVQLPDDLHVQAPTLLPRESLSFEFGHLDVCTLDITRLQCPDQPNQLSEQRRDSRGRRPRRNTTNSARRTPEVQCRNGTTLRNLRGTKYGILYARKNSSERVRRALQHSYYSVLSEENDNIQDDLEEYDQPRQCSSLSKPIFRQGTTNQNGQGEETNPEPPTPSI
ncbi:hypothetical protein FXO38_31924 [Capsicum annuum]|nr:hypothetical protein FXO38_31924 [Capsicum annuum]